MNKVIFGVNDNSLNFTGSTVAQVASQCKDLLGLSGDEIVKVNGSEAPANYTICDGDKIEFIKESGTKGSAAQVKVTFGVNSVTIDIGEGETVASVLNKAKDILGIDKVDSGIALNGTSVDGNAKVYSGDRLEIKKEAGEKG